MNKILEVILKLNDQFTAPLRQSEGGVKAFGSQMKNLLGGLVSLGAIWLNLNKAFDAADAFRVALQKLEGTAKITGIPIQYLTGIAEQAAEKFKLSKTQAADFAVEMAKLASKAGDVGKAGPALQAFLDIGAARGLSAGETLKAVQQAILGIDEGTDKLFNANPSVLYQQFADAIGTTAGKLTDQQKAQALLTAAMTDGSKVMGTYQQYLASTAGQLEIAKNKTESAYATLGIALNDLRQSMASAIAWMAEGMTSFIGGLQILGADAAESILQLPHQFKLAWALFIRAVANTIGESRVLLTLFGDGLTAIADKMGASGDRMMRESLKSIRNIKQGHDDVVAGIVSVVGAGEQKQTDLAKAGAGARKKTAEEEAAAKKEAKKKSEASLADLQKFYDAQSLATLEAQHVGYAELVKQFQAKMQGMDVEDKAKAQEILDKHGSRLIDIWNKNYAGLNPVMIKYSKAIKGVTTSFEEMPAKAEPALQLFPRMQKAAGELGPAFRDAARDIFEFADALGIADERFESIVGGVDKIGNALTKIGSGDVIGGLATGISGITSVLGGIFGDSPADRERKALLQKNNDRLAELKAKMGDLLNLSAPGGKIAALQEVDFGRLIDRAMNRDVGSSNYGKIASGGLAAYLATIGLSLSDFRGLADDLGIGLGEKNGFFDTQMVGQFIEAMRSSQFTGFGDTFAERLNRVDFLNGINGGGAQGELTGLADLVRGPQGSAAFARLFAGIGVSDGFNLEELSSIRMRTSLLANDFASGSVGARDLGGLSNSQFMQFLERFASRLDELVTTSTTTAGATSATAASSMATADAIAGGGLASTVGVQTADSYALTGLNTGRV